MNRNKKIRDIFKKRFKRARAKLDTRPKEERYVSKAERAKLESEEQVVGSDSKSEQSEQSGTDHN